MGLGKESKRGLSLNLTLVVSFLLILVLAPFVFSAVFKNNPVSATPDLTQPAENITINESTPEILSTENLIETQIPTSDVPSTQSIVKPLPVSEPIVVEEEPINGVNSNPLLNCGDTITTNTVLTADLLNCPNDGIIIGANNLELDCNGHIIGGTGTGIGILAIGKQNIIVRNCIVKNFGNGIYFDSTNSSQMINNTFTNNLASGINVASSTNNTLKNNIISSNGPSEPAIVLYSASKNSIESNLVLNNNNWGFLIYGSSNNNTLKSNIISNNTGIGIKVGDGSGNLIFNNFFNNSMNALDTSNNSWNTTKTIGTNIIGGPYLGGNFWSDYNGTDTDGDGIGDTNLPYNSNGNIINGGDYLPLVEFATPQLCVNAPSGMVAWWPGDGNANDIQDGNQGTLVNGATFTAGMVAQAFSFDGVDDRVEIPDSNNLDITQALTVDMWVSPNVYNEDGTLLVKGDYDGGFDSTVYGLYVTSNIDPTQRQIALSVSNNNVFWSAASPISWTAGSWHHVAGVYDGVASQGNRLKIYVDGVLVASPGCCVTSSISTNNKPLNIGGAPSFINQAPFRNFNGTIDEVEIFNRSLNSSEIQSIFNAGSAGKCKINTPTGTNVSVNLTACNTTLTFDNVTVGGNTVCETTTTPPSPASPPGFSIVPSSPPLYYDINVSANFTGNVTVCLVYDESQVNGNESNLRLRQFSNGWNDITVLPVDTVNNILCGRTNHFSFFAVTEPVYLCGDVNNDGVHSVIDVVNMINVAFRGQNQTGPAPLWVWDVNGDSVINIIDVVKIVNVAFRGANVTTELSCNEPVPNVQASTTITLQKISGGFSASASIDRNVAGMQFDLSYDSSKVKISGVKTTTRTSGMTITNTQISSGKNRIAIYSNDGEGFIKAGSGTLFTIQATGSDFSSLKITPIVVDYKTSNGFSDVKVSYKFKTTTRLLA